MKTLFSVLCAALAVLLAPPSEAATTGTLAGWTMDENGLGPVCVPGVPCEVIHYNNFFPEPTWSGGVAALTDWAAVPGHDIASGISLGGAVITTCIQTNCAPPDTVFYTYGNPYIGQTPSSPYLLTEVFHEYDPFADHMTSFNLLALLNSGISGQHCCWSYADLSDPTRVETVQGNVTTIMIPDPVFPLTAWMDPGSQAYWTPILKPIVDSAYTRPATTSTTTAAATNEAVASVSNETVASTVSTPAKKPHRTKPVAAVDRVKPTQTAQTDTTTSEPAPKKSKGNKHADQSQGSSSRARGSRGATAGGDSPQP